MKNEKTTAAADIGGTFIKGALIKDGTVIKRASSKTDISGGLATIRSSVFAVLDGLMPADGIAVASAGVIDAHKGVCLYATENLPGYTGFDIAGTLGKRYGVPCRAINDAHAAALSEGRACGLDSFVMLTLGTGIGGALYRNGNVVFGKGYREGAYGQIELHPGGLLCTCGKRGCAERYASAAALLRRTGEAGLTVRDGKEFFEFVKNGVPSALNILNGFLDDLASLIIKTSALTGESVFILGGGISESGGLWLDGLNARLPSGTYARLALAGNDAGIMGAYYWDPAKM